MLANGHYFMPLSFSKGLYCHIAILPYRNLCMIRAKIDKRLEMRFRELAMKRFGYCKGALTRAMEEAIIKWIASVEREEITFEGDPVEAIDGILSDIKIDAVELQHRIKDLWISKVLENVSNRH